MGKRIAGFFVVVALGMAWAVISTQYGIENATVSAVVTGAMMLVVFLGIYSLGTNGKPWFKDE